jgi:hypothetical protein
MAGTFYQLKPTEKGLSNVAKKDDYDYGTGDRTGTRSGDINVPADPNSGAKPLRSKFDSNIDVSEYKADSEKHIANVLRQSQSADGLGVFSKGNLRGKKM